MKKPASDKDVRKILKEVCGRTDEQIDAIIEFGQLSDALVHNKEKELKEQVRKLGEKYKKT